MLLSKKKYDVCCTQSKLEWKNAPHCKQDLIHVFPEIKLCSLVSNFIIYVSVHDLYISKIFPHILPQQNRRIDIGNL
jgi:hypothetical protein